jgi:hypothetical protein
MFAAGRSRAVRHAVNFVCARSAAVDDFLLRGDLGGMRCARWSHDRDPSPQVGDKLLTPAVRRVAERWPHEHPRTDRLRERNRSAPPARSHPGGEALQARPHRAGVGYGWRQAAADSEFARQLRHETPVEAQRIQEIPAPADVAHLLEHFDGKEALPG